MIEVTLRHKGVVYKVIDKLETDTDSFIWQEGNYSCDCNRALFIRRQVNKDFPEMSCDHTIELLGIDKKGS